MSETSQSPGISDVVLSNSSYTDFTGMTGGGSIYYRAPGYWFTTYNDTSKVEVAYKVVRELMKKKIVKVKELTEFFDAMDAVISVL